MLYGGKYNSPIGELYITNDEKSLLSVSFETGNFSLNIKNKITDNTIKQLNEYFQGKRKTFDLPLNPKGTEFQKKVWQELKKIPYGATKSYKNIAIAIGNPNSSRAVGNANNKNPIPIIIPCHRVIGTNKRLIGYAGGLDKKQKLLDIENRL